MTGLRIVDAGTVGPLRSQALWHGIATAMDADAGPTLSLCRPARPYVSIGYHRRLDEVDLELCRAEGLDVIRRQIGGGPVLLDADQLFFQLTLPARRAPASVERLYRELLAPAVTAFRMLGIGARLDGLNDIVVGARKLSGTGAGQLGSAVTVVGNVMARFPHERMARILALPDERMRAECLRLMRRHVTSLQDEGCTATLEEARSALRRAYTAAFGGSASVESLTARERDCVLEWERRLADPDWTAGPDLPARGVRQVKVRGDVWVVRGRHEETDVLASFAGGVVDRVEIRDAGLNGTAAAAAAALTGAPADPVELRARLAPFGAAAERVVAAIEPGLVVR